jgi:hypothetical protein
MIPSSTLHSSWRRKQVPIEVVITRVTLRTVSYIALDKTFSGTFHHIVFSRCRGIGERPRVPRGAGAFPSSYPAAAAVVVPQGLSARDGAQEEIAQTRMNTGDFCD